MKNLQAFKSQNFSGKKLIISDHLWQRSIFRFSCYNFFLNFLFKRLTYFSLILQTKNFNFLDESKFQNSSFEKAFFSHKLVKFLNNDWNNSKNYFFCEFKILGLGLRLKKSNELNLRSISLDLGYGHYLDYFLPLEVKCIRRKKKFVIFSYDIIVLNNIIHNLESFKPISPYKIRGLRNVRKLLVTKIGKKQSQR
jgi:ribosomal protein L6P/L9E